MLGESKSEVRRRYRNLRESISPVDRVAVDAVVAARVEQLVAFGHADTVFAYLSVGAEVDTRQIIRTAWGAGKLVAVPRCVPGTNQMRWHALADFDSLELGSFGIEEPPDDDSTLVEVPELGSDARAVALVPAYSFDGSGYRLGYGGGYYDVFLSSFGGVSVGLCRACQFSEVALPRDAHDVPVDIVVTEQRAMRICGPSNTVCLCRPYSKGNA